MLNIPSVNEIQDICLDTYGNTDYFLKLNKDTFMSGSRCIKEYLATIPAKKFYDAGNLRIEIKSRPILTVYKAQEINDKLDAMKAETENRIDSRMKEIEANLFSLQEQEQKKMHQRLEFGQRLRFLRYAVAELSAMFLEKEIQHKAYQIFAATIPSSTPEYRKKNILARIQEIKVLWTSLLEKKKEEGQLAADLEEFQHLSSVYSQIIIQEEGKSENLLQLTEK